MGATIGNLLNLMSTRSEDSVVVPGRFVLPSYRLEAEASDDDESGDGADDCTGAFCSALGMAIGRSCSGSLRVSSLTYAHITTYSGLRLLATGSLFVCGVWV